MTIKDLTDQQLADLVMDTKRLDAIRDMAADELERRRRELYDYAMAQS